MKLVELEVADSAASPPSHGNAVATGAVRIAGVEIRLAGASRCQHGALGFKYPHLLRFNIQYIGTCRANFPGVFVGLSDEINRAMMFEYIDIWRCYDLIDQRSCHCFTGSVGTVQNASMTVAALLG